MESVKNDGSHPRLYGVKVCDETENTREVWYRKVPRGLWKFHISRTKNSRLQVLSRRIWGPKLCRDVSSFCPLRVNFTDESIENKKKKKKTPREQTQCTRVSMARKRRQGEEKIVRSPFDGKRNIEEIVVKPAINAADGQSMGVSLPTLTLR